MLQSLEAAKTKVKVRVTGAEISTETTTMAMAVVIDCLTLLDFKQLQILLFSFVRVEAWVIGLDALALHRQIGKL